MISSHIALYFLKIFNAITSGSSSSLSRDEPSAPTDDWELSTTRLLDARTGMSLGLLRVIIGSTAKSSSLP